MSMRLVTDVMMRVACAAEIAVAVHSIIISISLSPFAIATIALAVAFDLAVDLTCDSIFASTFGLARKGLLFV